ncbi:MAG TPA: transcriptional regulator, partial [Alphaproteobacteria bacterium]|nr:transcriptional regulator [Alphaproteobacteria bacterium]
MPKIDLETAPRGKGTRYPAPYDEPCRGREWIDVSAPAGLTQFGAKLVTLAPGVWSSQRHWHMHEDELVYMIAGELILVTDGREDVMRPGDCAGFKAGERNGHCLQNRSGAAASFLVVGTRDDRDWGEYSDIDMRFSAGRY